MINDLRVEAFRLVILSVAKNLIVLRVLDPSQSLP